MPLCQVCKKSFESLRSDKLTCSATCRSRLARKKDISVAKVDLSVAPIVNVALTNATDKPAWKKVFDGEDSGVDVGYGKNDYTRAMVEERNKSGDDFVPNWYKLGFNSKNEYKEKAGWNNLMKPSKTKLGICKNEDCQNERRDGSAYCQECSDKHV